MLIKAFTKHPASVGETYWQHMSHALRFAIRLLFASFACFMHAIFPFLFVKTGSKQIDHLHIRMVSARDRSLTGWHYTI